MDLQLDTHHVGSWPMDAGVENEMIAIPPGQVTLSDRRTQRKWPIELAPYQLAAYPVTQARYAEITGQYPSAAKGDRLPVEGVSWWDAVRFCNALSEREGLTPAYRLHDDQGIEWAESADGYRLPTEAEWEYACRAGTTGARHGPLDEIAWYRGNSNERIHEVGGKKPNAWGLYDMLGNLFEWCWDIYDAEVYGTYRVLRGGGWFDEQWSCRPRCGGAATLAIKSTTWDSASLAAKGFRRPRSRPAHRNGKRAG